MYNTLGRRVKILVNEKQRSGNHGAIFDASGFAGVAYIYRLAAGNFVDAKKMLLIK